MFPDDWNPYINSALDAKDNSNEKTPSMFAEGTPKGVYYSCYICGRGIATIGDANVMSVAYQPSPTDQERRQGIAPSKYVLTYCKSCYKSHCR